MLYKNIYRIILAAVSFIAVWVILAYIPKPYEIFDVTTPTRSESVKVAVIYAKRIKEESKPYKEFEQYFEAEREKIHQVFLEKEIQLRDESARIKKMPTKKNKQRLHVQKLNKELQRKAIELENELQTQKEIFVKKANDITKNLQMFLDDAIETVIKKHGFNVVLNAELDDKTLVMYADKKFDITDNIIDNLNTVNIQF